MKESRAERFCRVAEARVNKAIKMIQLLGNCSGVAYEYSESQVDKAFSTLQQEIDAAKLRFATKKRKRFMLNDDEDTAPLQNQDLVAVTRCEDCQMWKSLLCIHSDNDLPFATGAKDFCSFAVPNEDTFIEEDADSAFPICATRNNSSNLEALNPCTGTSEETPHRETVTMQEGDVET